MKFPHALALLLALLASLHARAARETLSLAGEWRFQLDPSATGEQRTLFSGAATLDDTVTLPGSTDENKKGAPNTKRSTIELNRRYIYEGVAWYQRDITIPPGWAGRRVGLFLERTRFTKVWFDGAPVGEGDSLSTPHRFELTRNAAPGRHCITIQVDNSPSRYLMQLSHVFADRIQTNWNGILGRIELIATPATWIDDAQIFPDAARGEARVDLVIAGSRPAVPAGGKAKTTDVTYRVTLRVDDAPPSSREIRLGDGPLTRVSLTCPLPPGTTLWSEHAPNRHKLAIELDATPRGDDARIDTLEISFGARRFLRDGNQFTINGRPVFLRGTHDGGVFPLTGYASMDEADWERVFKTAASFGINFVRFHSWCPPEAAFRAADKLGIYLQPELPAWASFARPGLRDYLRREGEAVLRAYGNHPSFVMFALGNELAGDTEGRRDLVRHFKSLDSRRLYAQGSNNDFADKPGPLDVDDYWTVSATHREGGRVVFDIALTRGSMLHSYLGHLNNEYPPSTRTDYAASAARSPVPLLSHETGQYLMFPDFAELPKYTGVLRPSPMEIFRERLEQNGMSDLADKFFHASGKLAALCYKEDIESVMRTRGMAAFTLLDLKDYPGQGSAYVGMCNAFMEPKAFVRPGWFRQFSAPVSPLLRFDKRTWTSAETFRADFELAHYGPETLRDATPVVRLLDAAGRVLAEQKLPPRDLAPDGLLELGAAEFSFAQLSATAPAQLKCEALIEGTPWKNEYDLWLYPATTRYDISKKIIIADVIDDDLVRRLRDGATVLALPRMHDLGNTIDGQFIANFWTLAFFKSHRSPGTLGLLMDPRHPAFRHFPTEFHSNWQWWPMTRHGRPMILDHMPRELRPIVQVIDNFETSRKLGLLFEARLGKGRLLFTSIDFVNHRDKPEVRQLLLSLLRYVESDAFAPTVEITARQLLRLLRAPADDAKVESAVDPGING